jgi:hypothetical protein
MLISFTAATPALIWPRGAGRTVFDSRLLELGSLSKMLRDQFRLALGDLGELGFKHFGDTGMKRPSWLAKQRAVSRVLHQRVLKQVTGVGWCALPK